jgi:hypothetical protein
MSQKLVFVEREVNKCLPGMSDLYRDRVRHGGILSNTFIGRFPRDLNSGRFAVMEFADFEAKAWWWNRQVVSNQYGLAGRAARNWGPDTLEGNLSEEELKKNRRSQPEDTAMYKFRDEEYYLSKDFSLSDIEVPVLSVANWVSSIASIRCITTY